MRDKKQQKASGGGTGGGSVLWIGVVIGVVIVGGVAAALLMPTDEASPGPPPAPAPVAGAGPSLAPSMQPTVPQLGHILANDKGHELAMQGKYEEALVHYRRSIEYKPDFGLAHANLGRALMQLNRLDEAEASLTKASELDPYSAETQNSLGVLAALRQDFEKAAKHFEQSMALNRQFVNPYIGLARVHIAQGSFGDAQRLLNAAAQVAPDDPRIAKGRELLKRVQVSDVEIKEVPPPFP